MNPQEVLSLKSYRYVIEDGNVTVTISVTNKINNINNSNIINNNTQISYHYSYDITLLIVTLSFWEINNKI